VRGRSSQWLHERQRNCGLPAGASPHPRAEEPGAKPSGRPKAAFTCLADLDANLTVFSDASPGGLLAEQLHRAPLEGTEQRAWSHGTA
jgi:hypothetical protein